MESAEQLYEGYIGAVNTPDLPERARRLRACATEDFEIISPFPYAVKGIDEVATKLAEVAGAMPDGTLRLVPTSRVDAHHGYFRVTFENRNSNDEMVSTGMHLVETRDGKLSRIVVFVPDHPGAPD